MVALEVATVAVRLLDVELATRRVVGLLTLLLVLLEVELNTPEKLVAAVSVGSGDSVVSVGSSEMVGKVSVTPVSGLVVSRDGPGKE